MSIESIATQLAQTIQKEANINAIFGEPKKLDEHTIIPVARIKISLGAGGGGGTGPAPAGKSEGEAAGDVAKAAVGNALGAALQTVGGTGGGGSLDIEVQPLGFIRDGAEGPVFVAIDPTPEGLLGKVEHLVRGLRPGAKASEAGH